ncbi:MAG: hemolysin family protein [candidate division WOR-3 bacterium]
MYNLFFAILFLFFSFLLSASEMSFVSSNKIFLKIKSKKNRMYLNLLYFLNKPQNYLYTILISNNLSNILITTFMERFFVEKNLNFSPLVSTLYISILIMIFGEVVPKYLVSEKSEFYSLIFFYPVKILYFLLYPLIKIISKINQIFIIKEQKGLNKLILESENIKELLMKNLDFDENTGIEEDIVKGIFKIKDMRVKDISVKRKEVLMVSDDIKEEEFKKILTGSKKIYSKIPVYKDSIDNIIGVLNIFDLLKTKEFEIKKILKKPLFVNESISIGSVLDEMNSVGENFAIVIDEYGGFEGIITKEDIIEVIFGDIEDEHDKIDEQENILGIENGYISIDDFCEKYNVKIKSKNFTTLSGYIVYTLKRFPEKNDIVIVDNKIKIIVLEVKNMVVKKVKIEEIKK